MESADKLEFTGGKSMGLLDRLKKRKTENQNKEVDIFAKNSSVPI